LIDGLFWQVDDLRFELIAKTNMVFYKKTK